MIRGIFWGLVVVWIGVWIWLGTTVAPALFAFRLAWPLIFVILGLLGLVEMVQTAVRRRKYGTRVSKIGWKVFWGFLFIAVGLALWLSFAGIIAGFTQWWPALIVVLGLAIVVRVIVHYTRKRRPRGVTVVIDRLENGKIDVDEAVSEIRRAKGKCCDE